MAESKPNLQDTFLNRLRRDKTPVTVHVINGYQLNHIVITGYDSFVITAKSGAREILIYKHAISTVTPEGSAAQTEHDAAAKKESAEGAAGTAKTAKKENEKNE